MKKYLNEMVEKLKELIAIDSVMGAQAPGAPFGEGAKKALDYALALTHGMGFKTADIEGYIGYAEIGEGELFGVLTHLDTVPLGEGWKYPPLSGTIEDGRLYGRGAEDDKGPFIASLYALKALLDEGLIPKKRIRLIFGCNEESGWKCIERYLSTEEVPVSAFSPDGCFPVINCEKGLAHYELTLKKPECIGYIVSGERANIVPASAEADLKTISDAAIISAMQQNIKIQKTDSGNYILSATGKSVHGSTPQKGDNALTKLLKVISTIEPTLLKLAKGLADYNGKGCGLDLSDDASGPLTLNAGYMRTEGEKLILGIDIRYPVSYKEDEIRRRLADYFNEADIRLAHSHNSLYLPKDNALVKTLLEAYNEVTGENAEPIAIGGATYARALPQAVAFGVTFPNEDSLAHQANEHITLENFLKMAEIYKHALKKICF